MRKSTPLQYGIRALVYCVGLLFLAFGVVLSVNSNLGVSPVTSFPYVISCIVKAPLGICVTLTYCAFIAMQILIQRREFPVVNLLQIVFSTIFGYFVDFAEMVVGDFALPTYVGRLGMLAVSIVLIAVGLVVYMDAQLVAMPMEGLTDCIAKKLGVSFASLKTKIDCLIVVTGAVLGMVFLGEIVGIREGTVITAMLAGRLVGVMKKWISPMVGKICFGE